MASAGDGSESDTSSLPEVVEVAVFSPAQQRFLEAVEAGQLGTIGELITELNLGSVADTDFHIKLLHAAAMFGDRKTLKLLRGTGLLDVPARYEKSRVSNTSHTDGLSARSLDRPSTALDGEVPPDEGSPLHTACVQNNPLALKTLLSLRWPADHPRDGQGRTPLVTAVQAGGEDCTRLLLKAGADTQAHDMAGCLPLYHACQLDGAELVKIFLDHGISVKEAVCAWPPVPPLTAAVESCNIEAAAALIAAGAAVNDPCPEMGAFSTPLEQACLRGDVEMAEMLIQEGAAVFRGLHPQGWEVEPMQAACYCVDQEVAATVDVLVKHGADPDHRGRLVVGGSSTAPQVRRSRPLLTALEQDNRWAARALLYHGADVTAVMSPHALLTAVRSAFSTVRTLYRYSPDFCRRLPSSLSRLFASGSERVWNDDVIAAEATCTLLKLYVMTSARPCDVIVESGLDWVARRLQVAALSDEEDENTEDDLDGSDQTEVISAAPPTLAGFDLEYFGPWLKGKCQSPASLKHLARCTLRESLCVRFEASVEKLGCSKALQAQVFLHDV